MPLKMTETALESKEKERTEQRKRKTQIPLSEETEMLGNGEKNYMQIIFVPPETQVQCLNVYPSTFWSFLSDMLMGRNDSCGGAFSEQ